MLYAVRLTAFTIHTTATSVLVEDPQYPLSTVFEPTSHTPYTPSNRIQNAPLTPPAIGFSKSGEIAEKVATNACV
jgi:hypothetical protein